jgi:hypothetical protein
VFGSAENAQYTTDLCGFFKRNRWQAAVNGTWPNFGFGSLYFMKK